VREKLSLNAIVDPVKFADEFCGAIRSSPTIPEAFKPSSRQPIAIAKLLKAKQMRKKNILNQQDYVEAAVVTSHIEIRSEAESLAVQTYGYLAYTPEEKLKEVIMELAEAVVGKVSDEKVLNDWFKHRDEYGEDEKKALLARARQALAKTGMYYARHFINNFYVSGTGPEKGYSVRQYRSGNDDPSAIDFELTLDNAIADGKELCQLSYEDFLTREVRRQRRNVLYLQDMSASFDYRVLVSSAVCGSILVHGLPRDDQSAISLFSDKLEIIKRFSAKEDVMKITDKLLSMESSGGTNLHQAVKWARTEFSQSGRNQANFCLIFSDMGFETEDVELALDEITKMQNMDVRITFLRFKPFEHYYKAGSRLLADSGCQMVTVDNILDFPELMSRIISPA
jgi:Mg-chelatase subunit ChlD